MTKDDLAQIRTVLSKCQGCLEAVLDHAPSSTIATDVLAEVRKLVRRIDTEFAVEPTGYRCHVDGPHVYESNCKYCGVGEPAAPLVIGEPGVHPVNAIDRTGTPIRVTAEPLAPFCTCQQFAESRTCEHVVNRQAPAHKPGCPFHKGTANRPGES